WIGATGGGWVPACVALLTSVPPLGIGGPEGAPTIRTAPGMFGTGAGRNAADRIPGVLALVGGDAEAFAGDGAAGCTLPNGGGVAGRTFPAGGGVDSRTFPNGGGVAGRTFPAGGGGVAGRTLATGRGRVERRPVANRGGARSD